MIDFLIKSTVSLGIFLALYHWILEREKMHIFNRFYLLFSVVISLAIPFFSFEIIKIIPVVPETAPAITQIPNTINPLEISEIITANEAVNYGPYVVGSVYALITFILLLRFGNNIMKLHSKSKSNAIVQHKNANLVLVSEKILPHTFLNHIFINSDDYNNRNVEEELYTHELVHVTQKHTLDVLFIEFLKTIFWFNPLFIFYKKAIQLNHEFLADEKVVDCHNNIPFYQNLLLRKGSQTISLASNLNYLVTKKRLIMMTKNTSKKTAFLKKLTVIPIFAGLVFFLCLTITAQEKPIETKSNQVTTPTSNDPEDKIRDSYYANVRLLIKDLRSGEKIDKMYEELTLEERRRYLNWVPDMIIQKEVPQPLYVKLTTKNNAVWINGKTSSRETIKKYKRTDFVYYTYSFVHKNARTKQFPQSYQYSLYTQEYFDKNLKDSHLKFRNDTLKMVVSNWNKGDNKKVMKTVKADTIMWSTQGKEGYEMFINDSIKKKK